MKVKKEVVDVAVKVGVTILESAAEILVNKSQSPKDTHGPLVKTGPNAGKNRSRNKNGQWRAKRSDAGKKRK